MKLDYAVIGKRIQRLRKSKHISQELLAEMIGLSLSYVSYIERGIKFMSIETLIKIANALEVTPDYILSDSLKSHKTTTSNEFADIFSDCSNFEARIILDSSRALKRVLREHRFMYREPHDFEY